ncbi:translocase of chloroplast 120, chloroplastic-like [Rutidosis leptorrhynchoides]|uniref:translocase of chloroplast 120, chloroplastic-like n=1 Tax=Rutidosis leptorrhynchoides TaxID=125765 RepID=UPI003A98F806
MENGVSKVDVMKLKVDDSDKDDISVGVVSCNRIDEDFKNASNGGDSSVSDKIDVAESVDNKNDKDAFEAPSVIQMVKEKAGIDPVEEDTSIKAIDVKSTSNTTRDQPVFIESIEIVNATDSSSSDQPSALEAIEAVNNDDSEVKVLHLADVNKEINVSDIDYSKPLSGMEDIKAVINDVNEGEMPNSADVIDDSEENIDVNKEINASDVDSSEQLSEFEASNVMINDDNEEKVPGSADVNEVINASVNDSSQQLSCLEASESVNEVKSEEKVLNLVQAMDEKSISDNVVTDHASDLETVVSEIGGQDEAVKVVGPINEQNGSEDNNGIIDNGVSDNADVGKTVVHDDGVNGSLVGHRTQPDDEISAEANGDVIEKDPSVTEIKDDDILVTESKDDDSQNQRDTFEISRNISLNVANEPTSEQIQDAEQISSDSSSGHQVDKNLEQRSMSANDVIRVPVEEKTVTPENEKVAPKDSEMKQDIQVKKESELKPVIGLSLSTKKSAISTSVANSKHDSKPDQSPIPSSKPSSAPTPASSPASAQPAGLPRLEPAHRVVQPQVNGDARPLQNQVSDEPSNGEPDENDETREKLQMIRVKFLRLARRLGQTPHNVVVAQVLYRLGLAEQLRGNNGGRVAAFSFERASAMAEQLEAAGQEPLEFSCTIMVLGKSGVGKSATINSIFDEVKFGTNAFQHGTKKVQDVVGTVQGIKVRVIDTPGLLSSWADQKKNEKILHSVKRFIQKSPPDIVLYLDRLDMQSRDFGDLPLLRTITDIFGQSIWFNAIVVLTHAASAPPEGPNGTATSYDMFVTQRSHVVQQAIRQAAGDMRLMNPVSLVENHTACRTNRAGQRVLPNGQVWKPHLLLLSFASKILVEANMLLKLQDSPPGKPFASRSRPPPLPFILSNLLQSRPQLKLPHEQFGDDDDDVGDDEIDESSDEESSEYDELPPFKRLTSYQLSKLSKAQKKSYYDELEYREKLFMKKQLKEEKKRRRLMKKMAEAAKNVPTELADVVSQEDGNGAATVPVAVQDMNLPVSFDADNPTHRYRALDSANQWLVRPVLDPHGWDHDVGYEGINVEHLLALKETIPVSFSGQVTKDKKDANLQMEVSSAIKHGKSKSTTLAFDMQTVGKEMSYTIRSDTRFINYRKNKASAGFSATYFGDSLTGGFKFEDKLAINKRGQLVVAGGAVIGRGDVAYGGSLEATLRDKDYPLGRFLSTVGLSVMDWHGDLALGWNAQSQIPIGRFTNLIGRVNLNNKGSGQVSVRLNSSEQLQIALVALVPIVTKLLGYYQDRDSAY